MIINLVGGGTFSITSLGLNLFLPDLYTYSTMQVKHRQHLIRFRKGRESRGFLVRYFKKERFVCGGKIGLLSNRKLEDGNLCKHCATKLSP